MTVLVLLDHADGAVSQASRSAVAAAGRLGEVHGLVAGDGVAAVAEAAARIQGLSRVLVADAEAFAHSLPEPLAALLQSLSGAYDHVLAPATATGKNVLPRLAALLDVQPVSEVVAIEGPDTFVRPIYAGSALATVRSGDAKKLLTIRAAAFDPAPAEGGTATVEAATLPADLPAPARFVSAELSRSERPDLSSARVVVSGGRGMGSGENFSLLAPIADSLGAAIGASRAAVDAGYVPNDYQVGQTGKIVAPELYLAVGISGAIQHLAGMKDSKIIVAVNKDAEAPIFAVADYGLVGDLFTVLPELQAELNKTA
ncbi:electron transfer flavoprotein subunit alpha/FixB family protein [Rhizosaccharibacter radicis]|uniref:FAD-binding protein n=1 Tax=Rhizosaccharibacter radicis TaxID=2782605 RepID=A0ABT1VT26_9PROT|nr:FAD-binding protein [Acetobacteraceae bacterium KSS12]